MHPVSDADPFSPAFFDDPFPVHAALRDAGPAVWLTRYGIWTVARHAEVRTVLLDWGTYCSSRGVGLSDFAREKPWRLPSLVLETDPPKHGRARIVLSRILSAAALERLRDGLAAAADALVTRLLDLRDFDAVPAVAEAFPMQVFPDAVGLAQEGRENLLPYAGTVFNVFGPRNALFEAAVRDAGPLNQWVAWACRRENLAPGGFGAGIHAAADAGELTAEEAPLVVRSLLTAGVDTTVSGIGAALHCLARNPEQWACLRAGPGLARAAFEEALRYETPVQTFFRTVNGGATLGGVAMQDGDKVLMLLHAANRDPRKWDDPDRYDIQRRTAGHVAYGAGTHVCVGMLLARMEGEALLSAMARRIATLEITAEPVRRHNNTLRALASLPLRVTAA